MQEKERKVYSERENIDRISANETSGRDYAREGTKRGLMSIVANISERDSDSFVILFLLRF